MSLLTPFFMWHSVRDILLMKCFFSDSTKLEDFAESDQIDFEEATDFLDEAEDVIEQDSDGTEY